MIMSLAITVLLFTIVLIIHLMFARDRTINKLTVKPYIAMTMFLVLLIFQTTFLIMDAYEKCDDIKRFLYRAIQTFKAFFVFRIVVL